MKAKICEKCGYLVFDALAHDRLCEENMLRARVAELEKQVEIITEEHNAQAICAEDFAKTHAENGLFRHRVKQLEKQVESMRCCALCKSWQNYSDGQQDESMCWNRESEKYRRVGGISKFGKCEHWQSHDAAKEGGE